MGPGDGGCLRGTEMRRDPDAYSWTNSEWRTQAPLPHEEVVPLVLRELKQRVEAAISAGVEPAAMVLDPGFGFGKVLDENYPLLANFDELHTLGYPLLAGVSRKAFLAEGWRRSTDTMCQPISAEMRLWLP